MNQIFQCGVYEDDAEVRVIALQCISEVIENFYRYCEPFVASIIELTLRILSQDSDENCKKQAIEVWSNIADEEYHLSVRQLDGNLMIIQKNYTQLTEILIANVMKIEADRED